MIQKAGSVADNHLIATTWRVLLPYHITAIRGARSTLNYTTRTHWGARCPLSAMYNAHV